ncbi:hypothetical protein [Cloacibacterium sp. TD35]|uniref:hypothetical protein n=1 Tax=Cloacibacterium sp. TD35 TaxID=2976818 RepID=UPI00237E7EC7|nr:hypothetical protein [Cloacibacterium sp. TD35]WDT67292.1 hypothetical protein N7277_08090 [Cloacibacterium sp. TD35]
MKNLIILLFVIFYSCGGHSSPIVLDDNFIILDRNKEFPFSKLVGKYGLDSISKKRFNLPNSKSIIIEIHPDTTITANDYIDIDTRKLNGKKVKNKLFYINNFKENYPTMDLSVSTRPYFNEGGGISIYYRKKDSILALYVYMPFVPATKENNMKYMEGDYLRYIKVK